MSLFMAELVTRFGSLDPTREPNRAGSSNLSRVFDSSACGFFLEYFCCALRLFTEEKWWAGMPCVAEL